MVAYVRERFLVGKKATQKSDVETFKLRKLNELEISEQYQIEITKRFAAVRKLSDDEENNRGWENIKKNTKISPKSTAAQNMFRWRIFMFFRSREAG